MKFLCIACDEPMKLEESTPPADGAGFTATFRCPRCGHGIAMLTNAWETEAVASLGVKLANGRESRCPVGSMLSASREAAGGGAMPAGGEAATAGATIAAASSAAAGLPRSASPFAPHPTSAEGLAWTAGALARLDRIPEMVRPMAREGIERYARNVGRGVVDEALLEEARAAFAG